MKHSFTFNLMEQKNTAAQIAARAKTQRRENAVVPFVERRRGNTEKTKSRDVRIRH